MEIRGEVYVMLLNIYTAIKARLSDEVGATALEYGLLIGLIALAIVIGATALGSGLGNMFSEVATRVNAL